MPRYDKGGEGRWMVEFSDWLEYTSRDELKHQLAEAWYVSLSTILIGSVNATLLNLRGI